MKIGLPYFLSIVLVLVLMLVIAYGCIYVMNLLSGKKTNNKRLKIKEYLPLQAQVGLYLVSLDNEELLVAVSNKMIQSMQKISSISFDDELVKARKKKQNVSSSTN